MASDQEIKVSSRQTAEVPNETKAKPLIAKSPYRLFCKFDEDAIALKRKHFWRTKPEVAKRLTDLWEKASKATKKRFEDMAKQEQQRLALMQLADTPGEWWFEEGFGRRKVGHAMSNELDKALSRGQSCALVVSFPHTYEVTLKPSGFHQRNMNTGTVRELFRLSPPISRPVPAELREKLPSWMIHLPHAIRMWNEKPVPFYQEIEQDSPLYFEATNDFLTTIDSPLRPIILHVWAIINPLLYADFATKHRKMIAYEQRRLNCAGNHCTTPVEITHGRLFHGTTAGRLDSIIEHGFDPRLCDSGCALGIGAYFATSASYSDSYAKPDAQRRQYMFVVSVLTGRSCLGKVGDVLGKLIETETGIPGDCADSSTDSGRKVFCVFEQSQALPNS